tara:strand:+ start:1307 stop:2725 length:1419 start_codon:yes stop_codon:yes gene_type:complete
MAQYSREYLTKTHPDYDKSLQNWAFHLRSYLGGDDYQDGYYLNRYVLESDEEYVKRLGFTALDNHCRNVVQIYSSFLFRVQPSRNYGSLDDDPGLEQFIKDADLEGRSFANVIKEMQVHASVYGNCWAIIDKPDTNIETRAQELQQDIRPYISLYTPENIPNWKFERAPNGKFYLTELTVIESLQNDTAILKIFTPEEITTYEVEDYMKEYTASKPRFIDEKPNALGMIPAVILYNQKSSRRAIGISDLSDVAQLQQSIYNDYSEIEQLIRLSNHPSLVKTPNVEASAGAGSIIEMPEDLAGELKPYIIQPNSQSLDSIMNTIRMKVDAINRITHMGSVRGTEKTVNSGIALQTEFSLLNARLSEKADLLENAEEQIWSIFAKWQDKVFDGEIDYPDSFDLRDYAADLQFLQLAKASGVKSETFTKEIDKQIAKAVVEEDEAINQINSEIDSATTSIGQFSTNTEQIEEAAQ